jgi:hypothetical protein
MQKPITMKNQSLTEHLDHLQKVEELGHVVTNLILGKRGFSEAIMVPWAPPHDWLIKIFIEPIESFARELTKSRFVSFAISHKGKISEHSVDVVEVGFQPIEIFGHKAYQISIIVDLSDLEFPMVSIKENKSRDPKTHD